MAVSGKSDLIDVTVKIHHETAKAVLVSDDGDKENAKWVALSQCEIERGNGPYAQITMPEWLAMEKGFI